VAIDCAGVNEGILIGGPVTVTKNQSFLAGSAWVLFRQFAATDTKICEYSISNNVNARFTLQYDSLTPGRIEVAGRALDADAIRNLVSPTSLTLGAWTHVVGVLDYANATGEIYYDAVLVASGALSGTFGATQTANTNSQSASIGCRANSTQGPNALIDDFRLYNRRLSQNEVSTIFAGRGKDSILEGLLHRYPLNDGAPPDAVASCVCIANAERIVGTPLGSPTFAPGTTVPRSRTTPMVGLY
jgi:hypothetical protein